MAQSPIRGRSQKVNGVIIFIVILAIATFIVISQRMQNQYDNIMTFAIENKSVLITNEVDQFFEPMRIVQTLNDSLWNTEHDFYFEALSHENFSRSLVMLYPQLNSIFYGDSLGNFVMYYQDERGEVHTKIVLNNKTKPETIWRYYEGSEVSRISRVDYVDFDPRTRPWYLGAMSTGAFFLTEPYEFFTAKVQGITASHVIYDSKGGNWGSLGMDLKMSDLKSYLAKINLLGNGHAFLVTAQNQIVFPEEESLTLGEQQQLLEYLRSDEGTNLLKMNDGRYFIKGKVLEDFYNPLSVGILFEYTEFAKELDQSEWLIWTVTFLMLVLIFMFVYNIWIDEAQKKELIVAATYDQLTGLRNRNSFDEQYTLLLNAYKREKIPFSVVVGDIDLFKIINDTYGHGFGDEVLIAVTKIIEGGMRDTDTVFRWGGEEFLMLLSNAHLDEALEVAQRIKKRIEDAEISVGDVMVQTTMSFGVACYNGEVEAKDLIKRADEKLYSAKNNGRNAVEG